MKSPSVKLHGGCRRQILLSIVAVGSLWSIAKSFSNGDIYSVDIVDELRRRREDLEFAPTVSSNHIAAVTPRLHQWDDDSWFVSSDRFWNVQSSTNPPGKLGLSSRTIQYPLSVINKTLEQEYNGTDVDHDDFELEWFTTCEPVLQSRFRPTCNCLHETNAFESSSVTLLSMDGSWRSVWKVHDIDERFAILKMLQLYRNYTEESFMAHETDALVMDRLTGSPHITSSYGFCGQSVLTEIAESSGGKVIKDSTLSWRERLTIGRDIAKGLAELHTLEPWSEYESMVQNLSQSSDPVGSARAQTSHSPVIFAHHDINSANMISLRPRQAHWNDFNLGVLSKTYRNTDEACPVPVRFEGVLWRSPEEIENAYGHVSTLQPADVYAFGTLLFTVLTKHQPWTHLEEGEVTDERIKMKKKEGDLPNLPVKYHPKRAEAKILWAATKACFRRDPAERPTAYRLALGLGLALERLRIRKALTEEDIEKLFAG